MARQKGRMTPEAQRIAIATSCGWTGIQYGWPDIYAPAFVDRILSGIHPDGQRKVVPDYINDLDAMNEAEKRLEKWGDASEDMRFKYVDALIDVTRCDCRDTWEQMFVLANASPAQRAKAFLIAIRKQRR